MIREKPNVLLIILDSARARNTSLQGYHRETTPFLKEFAKSATTYTQARAPAGRSLPSHASIFSGYLPQEHQINGLDSKLEHDANIFSQLADEGYETGLFTDNPYLTDLETGLSSGFNTIVNNRDLFEEGVSPSAFVEEESLDRSEFLSRALKSESPAKSILNGVSWMLKWRFPKLAPKGTVFSPGFTYAKSFHEWHEDIDGEWAACINLMDTHVPFRPKEEYDRWNTKESKKAFDKFDLDDIGLDEQWKYALLENRYDGTIRQADAVVEEIMRDLEESGELSNTFVIITADHGEGFGERNPVHSEPSIGHGDAIDETLLHVPLIVKAPGQEDGMTVRDPVGLVDTPIAIRQAIENEVDSPTFETDRTVLAGGLREGEITDAAYERHESRGVRKFTRGIRETSTIHAATPRASYHLSDEIPSAVEDEMDELSQASVTQSTESEVSGSTQQQLEALGYAE